MSNHLYILTGAMGSGKTTLLNALSTAGITVVSEPARDIIEEQRLIQGDGLYDKNPKLFCELMLSRSIQAYKIYQDCKSPVIFDRSLVDMISYFDLFKINSDHAKRAAEKYRYHHNVLVLPAWEEIYSTDQDRTMSYEAAKIFGEDTEKHYIDLAYQLNFVPKASIQDRVKFLLKQIDSA